MNPYAEEKMTNISSLADRFATYTIEKTGPQIQFEYQEALVKASKVTGMQFFVMHKRVEAGFGTITMEKVTNLLNSWSSEAEKHVNPGMIFNSRFKRFRESQVKRKSGELNLEYVCQMMYSKSSSSGS
jgi:hypothetical protein